MWEGWSAPISSFCLASSPLAKSGNIIFSKPSSWHSSSRHHSPLLKPAPPPEIQTDGSKHKFSAIEKGERGKKKEIKNTLNLYQEFIATFLHTVQSFIIPNYLVNFIWIYCSCRRRCFFYIQHLDKTFERSETLNSSKTVRLSISGCETWCYWIPDTAKADIWYLYFGAIEKNMTRMWYTYKVPFIHGAPILPILVHWFSQKTWKAEGRFVLPSLCRCGHWSIRRERGTLEGYHGEDRGGEGGENYNFGLPYYNITSSPIPPLETDIPMWFLPQSQLTHSYPR